MMRWFITKKMLVVLIGILVAIIFWLTATGCIPVTVRPEFDAQDRPIAIPVTPVGSVTATGELVPIYPVSDEGPKPTNWAAFGAVAATILSAFLAAYGINLRGAVSRLTTGLRITSDLADANARAETDDEVVKNKMIARHQQEQAGVHAIVQRIRGKA